MKVITQESAYLPNKRQDRVVYVSKLPGKYVSVITEKHWNISFLYNKYSFVNR